MRNSFFRSGSLPTLLLSFGFLSNLSLTQAAERVEIAQNQLVVDGKAQPQLFGAELQYFRLRGGYGRNVPREKVIELWNRALDRMVEAKMNVISFYIPWDFHEYVEGKFDFTGTVDEDGDGKPDYPSRDLFTFFKLIEQHGIHRIMVRPGPYVNAEWGFLGFGAVPLWFHEKFPNSHMRNPSGLKTKLYDYHNPDFIHYSQLWFKALHQQVLQHFMGPGKPVLFVQLDNETNFMWQSIYNHDYGTRAVERYQYFLKDRYATLDELNRSQQTSVINWNEVQPPTVFGRNLAQDRDWYQFQDESIHSYLKIVRQSWENLGVREPNVLFTLAESYNALDHGLLPNFRFRNDPGATGLMTINLYPKTYENPNQSFLNLPFKSDHDVKAVASANAYYYGSRQQWALGPETQGGWWRGIPVGDAARKQTYLSTVGHGMKAMFIYYFSEGDNWQVEWARNQVEPIYEEELKIEGFVGTPLAELPTDFWKKLQKKVEEQVLVGIDAKATLSQDLEQAKTLYFDAPLGPNAEARAPFALVKEMGALFASQAGFLSQATELVDPVAMIKDVDDQAPSSVPGLDALKMNSDWSGGLLGYLLQAGINPVFHHWNINPTTQLSENRLFFYQDAGRAPSELVEVLRKQMEEGKTVVSFLGNSLAKGLGFAFPSESTTLKNPAALQFGKETFEAATNPFAAYELPRDEGACKALLFYNEKPVAYQCSVGAGHFIQIGALFYDIYNSDYYSEVKDGVARRHFLESVLKIAGVVPQIRILEGGDRVVAFARRVVGQSGLWLTVKSARTDNVSVHIEVPMGRIVKVELAPYGSTALYIP